MSSIIILQLKVNNKEKAYKHPSTVNLNNLDKESQKINPWSAVIYSDMGFYCSEYHTIISVNQSTPTHTALTLTLTTHLHTDTSAHTHLGPLKQTGEITTGLRHRTNLYCRNYISMKYRNTAHDTSVVELQFYSNR